MTVYIGHNYLGHKYLGHSCLCQNYLGHDFFGQVLSMSEIEGRMAALEAKWEQKKPGLYGLIARGAACL